MHSIYLLQFEFSVSEKISGLHFFQGIYWSALFREFLRKHIPEDYEQWDYLDKLGIYPIAVSNGVRDYFTGEKLYFHLILPIEHLDKLLSALKSICSNKYREHAYPKHSVLHPGKNLGLNCVRCLVSGETKPEHWQAVDADFLMREAQSLNALSELTLVFSTPLRLSRIEKSKDRPWVDARYWDSHAFLRKLSDSLSAGIPEYEIAQVETISQGFCWIDVFDSEKPLGGLCGAIKIRIPCSENLLRLLVQGQYSGIGKNRSLGFGFYYIAESTINPLFSLPAGAVTLQKRAAEKELLRKTLEELHSDSAGLDNLTADDLKLNTEEYLNTIQKCISENAYIPGETKKTLLRSPEGKERWIEIRSIRERHLLRTIATTIYDAIDEQIPYSIYAYRRNKGYLDAARAVQNGFKKGFNIAIATDIDAYFDSIDCSILYLQMLGLFGTDPIHRILRSIIELKEKGIEQGNPLSPVLSNIHLLPLDRELGRSGFHYVRYADDFVWMNKHISDDNSMLNQISTILDLLHLKLSAEKTAIFSQNDVVTFLGCRISKGAVLKIADQANIPESIPEKVDECIDYERTPEQNVLPDIKDGIPVYLSFQDATVRSTETEIIISDAQDTRHISWNSVSRIVVIGKPRISTNTIYKALALKKPVVFITIMGKPIGAFYPYFATHTPHDICEASGNPYPDFQVSFVRNIAMAKLNNQSILLQKNSIDPSAILALRYKCKNLTDPDAIRGMEGAGAAMYWKHFSSLVHPFEFSTRQYHPSPDPVNAMLSLGYIILYYRMAEALFAAGLSPWDGIFHQKHNLHYALASDMIEPFRFLVDRIVLSLINTNQVQPTDFTISDSKTGSYCRMNSDGFRKFIQRYEFTMHNRIKNDQGEEHSWAEMLDFACRQLVNCLRIGIPFQPYLYKK